MIYPLALDCDSAHLGAALSHVHLFEDDRYDLLKDSGLDKMRERAQDVSYCLGSFFSSSWTSSGPMIT
jgi:hypothetical protein